jgi:membrane fusion protein (multidrug efflux system)
MNKKTIAGIVGSLLVIIAVYFIYDAYLYVETDNAQIDASAVMLASKVSGFVKSINVKEGQLVKKGDVLLEIDNRDYVNAINQVKGDLNSLAAKKKDIEKNYKRTSELFKKDAISSQQFDQSEATYNEIKSKYEALQALVSQSELNLENTIIKAPVDGYIAKKSAEVGQLAAPGVPLFGLVDAKDRTVVANFKETDISKIKIGAKVVIDIDAIPSRKFEGVVESLSSATGATFTLLPPDNATGNFTKVVQRIPVRINFINVKDDEISLLRAGLSANVKVRKE